MFLATSHTFSGCGYPKVLVRVRISRAKVGYFLIVLLLLDKVSSYHCFSSGETKTCPSLKMCSVSNSKLSSLSKLSLYVSILGSSNSSSWYSSSSTSTSTSCSDSPFESEPLRKRASHLPFGFINGGSVAFVLVPEGLTYHNFPLCQFSESVAQGKIC